MNAGVSYYVDDVNGDDSRTKIQAQNPSTPWKSLTPVNGYFYIGGDSIKFKCGGVWRGSIKGKGGGGISKKHIVFTSYGTGAKPLFLGSLNKSSVSDWVDEGNNIWHCKDTTHSDVGNVIFTFNNALVFGHKKWQASDLKVQGDFWYDRWNSYNLKVYSTVNPALKYSGIELALSRKEYMVSFSGQDYMVVENLEFKYGGGYCIKGHQSSNLIFQNLKITYMGGGDMDYANGFKGSKGQDTSRNIRYGNAIEFNGNCNNMIVRNNEVGEMYDCGVGCEMYVSNSKMYNLYFYNNIIYNCGLASLDFWGRDDSHTSLYNNIHFENNTCYNAGAGWGYEERPDKYGGQVNFSFTNISNKNIFFQNNIFYNSSAVGSSYPIYFSYVSNVDAAFLKLNNNLVYQEDSANFIAVFYADSVKDYIYNQATVAGVAKFKTQTGKDLNSVFANPLVVNPSGFDFHLLANSPCINTGITDSITNDFSYNLRSDGYYDIGAYEYSAISVNTIHPSISLSGMVYPNPISGAAVLQISSGENTAAVITIYDMLGQKIWTENVNLSEGQNQIPLSVNELSNGIYLLVIHSASMQKSLMVEVFK